MGDSLVSIQPRKSFSFFLFIIFIVVCISTTPTLSRKSLSTISNGLVLKLVPRDLIRPPTYPPGSTLLERMDLALSRVLTDRRYRPPFSEKEVSPMYPGNNAFIVSFKIGSQITPQFASLDTRSQFLWVQCAGYEHDRKTTNPTYDPTVSTWYKPSTCLPDGDWYCKRVPGGQCDSQNRCEYNIKFGDGSTSKGFLGFENITFNSPDRRTKYFTQNVLFGCGMDNFDQNLVEDGVFGIGGTLSILKQTDRKISFCFGGISDASIPSHLALGAQARFLGVPVLFLLQQDEYHVTLQSIVFGQNQRISMSPVSVTVDTGATLTSIRDDIYKQIRTTVNELIGTKMKRILSRVVKNGLCYEGPTLISDFPNVTISFSQESALLLDIRGMFWKTPGENAFCLAFEPSDDPNNNILGSVNMQYHNVGFDLNTRDAYFLRIDDCGQI